MANRSVVQTAQKANRRRSPASLEEREAKNSEKLTPGGHAEPPPVEPEVRPAPDRHQARIDADNRQAARLHRRIESLGGDVASDTETMGALCQQIASLGRAVAPANAQNIVNDARECLSQLCVYAELVRGSLVAIEGEV